MPTCLPGDAFTRARAARLRADSVEHRALLATQPNVPGHGIARPTTGIPGHLGGARAAALPAESRRRSAPLQNPMRNEVPHRLIARLLALFALALLLALPARAEPAKVVIGAYVNKLYEISFPESRYAVDFYIWFRWKAEGELKDYKPLESMELINGRIDSKTSIVEKKIGDMNYASARVAATIFKNWELRAFPFDNHRLFVHVEDSQFVAEQMVYVSDETNSRIGDELSVPGWNLGRFTPMVTNKTYKTNYGDVSLPTDALSNYSRFTFGMNMERANFGSAAKLLSTVLAATLVAFIAFAIRPVDVDPRFGLPVGALFAVAASAFVVASSVPDSGVLTVADQMHMLSMAFIFFVLVESAVSLKWDESEQEAKWRRLDRIALVVFPVLFVVFAGWIITAGLRSITLTN
jgi:hypothetical protein